jgi:L-ascorbate metabolism protein UlaG (beta-lactamase superfamily)
VDITWLGHSCFRIRGSQAIIITDPYPPTIGYTLGKQQADIVTISHAHPGHSYAAGVTSDHHLVKGPGEYEIAGVLMLGITTFHDSIKGQSRGKNTVYVMEVDGVNICHLGDIGHVLTDQQLEELGTIDIVMVPVGGGNSLTASMAAELIRKVEPKIVLPMHYKTAWTNRDLDPVDNFLKEMGVSVAEPKPKLTVTKNTLPLVTQVVILNV